MEMMNGFASCLIKVRQLHIGFPSLFSHYPEGMKHEELIEIHKYVQNAMDQPREIPEASGYLRRVIIGTGKYLIMGISGYAQHLVAEIQNIPHQLVDFTDRGCPGFIGFVWNLETTPIQQIVFPSLSAFGAAFQELIIEHWEDSKHSAWAYETRSGIEIPYKYSVSGELIPIPVESVVLNHDKRKIYSFDRSKENALIYQTIAEAIKKQAVSVCTDLYFDSEAGSSFLNMTTDLKGDSVVCIENSRFIQKRNTTKPVLEVETEQCRTSAETGRSREGGLDNVRTSMDNNVNGGLALSATLSEEEIKTVYLKFSYERCETTCWLEGQFLKQLVATYNNYGYNFSYRKIDHLLPVPTCIYECVFSTPILLEDFREICKGILDYFYKQKWVYKNKKNGQCIVKDTSGRKEFRVFVVKKILNMIFLTSEKEILLDDSKFATEKSKSTRNRNCTKNKKQNSNYDPLIERIKQNGSGQQVKKRSDDDELFKM